MARLQTDDDFRKALETSKTFAVIGAHPKKERPAHYVPAYLVDHGYKVFPVNSRYVGTELFGATVVATLTDIEEPVDVVDVFRRSAAVGEHLDEILAMDPLPKIVWMQKGVQNEEVAAALEERGITVAQDACPKEKHQELF